MYVCMCVSESVFMHTFTKDRLAYRHILYLSHGYSGCQTTRYFGLLVIIRLIKYSWFLFFEIFCDSSKGKDSYTHFLMYTPYTLVKCVRAVIRAF